MNPLLIFLLVTGIVVLIFGILTFAGRTPLGKRSFYFTGIELDKSVMGLAFFFLGMFMVIIFLIEVLGPHFRKEGL